jgi:hypothetical protein
MAMQCAGTNYDLDGEWGKSMAIDEAREGIRRRRETGGDG